MTAEGAPLSRGAPPYGLFSVAAIVEDMDPRAHNGVQYTAMCDPSVRPYPIAACTAGSAPNNPPKVGARSTEIATAVPFAIYVAEECFPGGASEAEATERLRGRLAAGEQTAVEREVQDGAVGARPWLRDPDGEVLADGAPLPLADAVGVLEQRSVALGREAVLHAPRLLGPILDAAHAVAADRGRITTMLGTPVVLGAGYTGEPPEGTADGGQVWLYATARPTVRRSALVEPAHWADGAFNPRTNVPFLLAERVYVVDWPCGVLAVRTTIPRPVADAGEGAA